MKGIIQYDLPEEQDSFQTAVDGWRYKEVINEMYNWLRQLSKYEGKDTVTVEEVREKLAELERENLE